MAAVVGLALKFPALGVTLGRWHLLKAAIFAAFLITGLTLETGRLGHQIKNFKAVAAALISTFVLFPIVALLCGKVIFGQSEDYLVGICILAVAPVTIASGAVLTGIARGNVPLSLLICVVSNFVALVTAPLSLNVLLKFDQEICLPVGKMITSLVLVVLLPTLIGQVLRIPLKARLDSCKKGFSIFSLLVVLLIIFNAVAGSAEKLVQSGWAIAHILVFTAALHVLILLLNLAISRLIRLDLPSSAAFTIHTSQKTLTISFIIWSGYFPNFTLAMLPVIAYHLTQTIIDTLVAHRFGEVIARRDPADF